VPLSPSSII